MNEKLDITPKPKPSLDEMVKGVLTSSGIGDTGNNFYKFNPALSAPERWSRVIPVQTYDGYIKKTWGSHAGLPEAVVAASDKSFVEAYDAFANKFNTVRGEGVASQEQATELSSIIEEVGAFIHDYCHKLPR